MQYCNLCTKLYEFTTEKTVTLKWNISLDLFVSRRCNYDDA